MENKFGKKKIGKLFFGISSQNMVFSENTYKLFFSMFFILFYERKNMEKKNTLEPLVLQPTSCEGLHRSQLQKKKMHDQICFVDRKM